MKRPASSQSSSNVDSSLLFVMRDLELCSRPNGRVSDLAATPGYVLLITVGGEGSLVVDAIEHRLVRGKCHLLPPCILHSVISTGSASGELRYYLLLFDVCRPQSTNERAEQGQAEPEDEQPVPSALACRELHIEPFPAFLQRVAELHGLEQTDHVLRELDRQSRFCQLLLDALGADDGAAAAPDAGRAVEGTIRHIQIGYQGELTVAALAAQANMGRWRYTRLFKQMTGRTPIDYIAHVRMEQAKRLLLQSDSKQADIAAAVGFRDESYFHRRFKQTTGMTPKQYARAGRHDARIVALFLEDYLLALGVRPVLQWQWDGEDGPRPYYLGLNDTPYFQYSDNLQPLLSARPDLILLSYYHDEIDKNVYSSIAPTHKFDWVWDMMDWRREFREVADFFGKRQIAEARLAAFERKAEETRCFVRSAFGGSTVAFLRVEADRLLLYGGNRGGGYIGPIVYGEMELTPPPLVKQMTWGRHDPVTVTLDQLATLGADVLFLISHNRKLAERFLDEAAKTDWWRSLPAARNGRIHWLESAHWLNKGILSHHRKLDDLHRICASVPACSPDWLG